LSTWSAIAARVVTQIQTVPNIGRVHDRRRFSVNNEDTAAWAFARIGDEDVLRVWFTYLKRMPNTRREGGGSHRQWNESIGVEGYLALADSASSENTMIELVRSVMTVLDADSLTGLGGLVMGGSGPCVLVENQPRFFGMWAAHHVEIELPVWEIVTP
jgi:hypothetical protein